MENTVRSAGHKLYGTQDMVRIRSSECAGCGACCRGMGDTIVLDPYDVWQLWEATGRTFEELLGAGIDLHVEEGVILPHLMMGADSESCVFLGEDGRCGIHAHRPGICRLFPLGREFLEEAGGELSSGGRTSYFIVPEGCVKGGLSKVRVDKWLGISNLPRYEQFKLAWHGLLRRLRARLAAEESEEISRNVTLYFLRTFFMEPYPVPRVEAALGTCTESAVRQGTDAGGAAAFYAEFDRRADVFTSAAL